MLKKLALKVSILLTAPWLLVGCALMAPARTANVNLYTLNPSLNSPTMLSADNRSNISLLVLPTLANAEFTSHKMAYITKEHQIGYFAQNQWASTPTQMLTPLITQSLRASHRFHAVVNAPFIGLVQLRLNTQLLVFQQEFITKPSQFYMVLAAQLISATTDKIIASGQFTATVSAPTDNPYGGVIAANEATARILTQLTRFCVRGLHSARKEQRHLV